MHKDHFWPSFVNTLREDNPHVMLPEVKDFFGFIDLMENLNHGSKKVVLLLDDLDAMRCYPYAINTFFSAMQHIRNRSERYPLHVSFASFLFVSFDPILYVTFFHSLVDCSQL